MTRFHPAQILASYKSRRVLVTGHTGFKGSWMTSWLEALGAEVAGLALAPDQGLDNLFDRAGLKRSCRSFIGDIRDFDTVTAVFQEAQPDIVFHLAAQPLVQRSYVDPIGTISTNVLGTAHVLEASRRTSTVCAVVNVTTDKVYRNREWTWPYREIDELGGYDPYSASKAGAEMVARTYRTALAPKERPFALVSVRGGNVLGGGDWSADRLVPDIVRALRSQAPLEIRNPDAVRPWQHVLDLCYAYLLIGHVLATDAGAEDIEAWNIGPDPATSVPVRMLVDVFLERWGALQHPLLMGRSENFESHTLSLDSSLARARLGWGPTLDFTDTIGMTSEWYRDYVNEPERARDILDAQRADFENRLLRRDEHAASCLGQAENTRAETHV